MYTLNPLTQARLIVTASDAAGATLPAPVVAAYERAARVTTAAQHLHPGPDALTAAVVSALDGGRDPATDPEVARLHLASILGSGAGTSRTVEDVVGGQLLDTFREHADAIVAAWRKPFDAAAVVLTRARQRIGDLPLDDSAAILRLGGDIGAHWGAGQDANAVIGQLDQAWVNLAGLTGFAPVHPRRGVLRLADATDPATWTARNLDRKNVGGWDALRAGLTLDLADSAEYRRRVAALDRAEAAIATAAVPVDKLRAANADFHAASSTLVSGELVGESAVAPPGDGDGGEVGLAQDG